MKIQVKGPDGVSSMGWYETERGAVAAIEAKHDAHELGKAIARMKKRRAAATAPRDRELIPGTVPNLHIPSWGPEDEDEFQQLLARMRQLEAAAREIQ